MDKRRFTTKENELMFLCSAISMSYADEILGQVGSILEAAHIVSETANSFYEANVQELRSNEYSGDEYAARLEFHTLRYIDKHFNFKLTSLITA
jgi:hypothetical protein